jgi:hypothetical protein
MNDLRTAAQRLLDAIDSALPEAPLCSAFDVVADTADDLRKALAYREDKAQAAFEHWVETVEATQGCAISRNAVVDAAPIIQPEIKDDKPFGYFRAEPFGWTDCAPTDEGAIPLYTKVDSQGIAKQIPPEAQTEAEKIAYCAGWWAAMQKMREQAEPVADAMKTVIKAMQADPDYAWSWHCNVAMAFADAGGDPYTANQGAARFMRLLANVDPAHELPPHPLRQWQGLTEEEVFHVENNVPDSVISDRQWTVYFARAIEAALRRKNHD